MKKYELTTETKLNDAELSWAVDVKCLIEQELGEATAMLKQFVESGYTSRSIYEKLRNSIINMTNHVTDFGAVLPEEPVLRYTPTSKEVIMAMAGISV